MGNGQFSVTNLDLGLYSGQTGYFYESCGETYLFSTQGGGTQLEPNTNGTWNGTNTITVKWVTNDNNPEVAKTLRLILNPTDPTPASPTGVSASILNNTTMEVRWIGSAFETQYVIERSTTSGTGFTEIATVNYPTRTYLDNTVALNTNYYYRVKARNTTGTSAASAESTVVNFKRPNFILAANSVTAATGNTGGTLWGDIDNDGDEDLIIIPFDFFSTTLNTPSVFRNDGSGNFSSVDAGFELSKYAAGTMADYDNDGNLDVYFTTFNNVNKLYKGAGNFSFTSVTGTPLTFAAGDVDDSSFAPMWIDYNKDGRLDLFITNQSKQSLLFKQNDDGSFTQETTGLLATSITHGLDATWVDYDNDGDMDVFFVNGEDNNTSTNNPCLLYTNNGNGTFTNLASAGFDLSSSANSPISAAWGDYNNDGFLDVFVANQQDAPTSTNYLYRNNGNGTFTKQTTSLVMETQSIGTFGGVWGDINNDGLLDLLLAKPGKNIIYINQGAAFTKVIAEKFNDPFYANLSLSLADYNKDGLLDVAVGNNDPNLFTESGVLNPAGVNNLLFLNNNTPGNYIQLKLTGTVSNKSAIGARVVIRTGTSTFQHRQVLGRTSFLSQNSSILHFGLGAATTVAAIEVRWPSGIIQTLTNVPANGIIEIIEDNTGPVITQLSPLNAATDINANTTLAVTFNEATNAVALRNLRVFKTTDLVSPVATVAVTSAVKTGNTFTFTLAQKLENSTSYSISIEAGAFEDIYGNDFTGLATSAWQFTTTAGPATTLLSPANNANNVAVNTTLEITFNKAVTGVAGKSVDVFIQGSDAPEFSIDAATGTIAGNKITFTLPETLAFQTLYDVEVEAGAFIDNFSNASNLITWSFLTVDNIAPVINFTAPVSINKGTATTLSPLITDNSGEIGTAVLHYRKISASTFSTLAGSISASVANQFDFAVPATFFDETGLEYYFSATDLSGNEVRSPAGTNTHKLLVRYSLDDSEIPSAQLGFGGAKTNWKIFSVPFELGNNNSVSSIFDELSDLENKIDYRLLKYKDQTGWGEFPSDFSTITRGEGYFINIKVAEDILIGEGLLAPANDRNNLFTLNLKQGWNMIGNPYLSTISWADVSAYNALTGTNAVLVKYTSGQYVQTNQNLLPFEGGLVFASAAATISIPFAGQNSVTTRQDEVIFSESDWLMPLTIMNGEVENTFGGIGMHTMADESFDQFDGSIFKIPYLLW
ncbi:MAG: hypothetical protein EBR30_22640 [Cytophagia bacterium]|nr:hypothetical protein [Cytophagia bacterium]